MPGPFALNLPDFTPRDPSGAAEQALAFLREMVGQDYGYGIVGQIASRIIDGYAYDEVEYARQWLDGLPASAETQTQATGGEAYLVTRRPDGLYDARTLPDEAYPELGYYRASGVPRDELACLVAGGYLIRGSQVTVDDLYEAHFTENIRP